LLVERLFLVDFFVARGSNARWYFSTYHFCKGMTLLKAEAQPKSLADFEKAYSLRSFDRHDFMKHLFSSPDSARIGLAQSALDAAQ